MEQTTRLTQALEACLERMKAAGMDADAALSSCSDLAPDAVAELRILAQLAADLEALPKAENPKAAFKAQLAEELAAYSAAELAKLAELAADLESLPKAENPKAAFKASLAEQLAAHSAADLAKLASLASDLEALPKAEDPSADFKARLAQALAARPVAESAPAASPLSDRARADALDAALSAAERGERSATPSADLAGRQIASLIALALTLRSLPKAPAPAPAFVTLLARQLASAPWPASLSRTARSTVELVLSLDAALRGDAAARQAQREDPEIAPLITLAENLESMPGVESPSTDFRSELARQLAEAPEPARTRDREAAPVLMGLMQRLWQSTAFTAATAATVLMFAGASLVYRAADAEPGEALYPLNQILTDLQQNLQPEPRSAALPDSATQPERQTKPIDRSHVSRVGDPSAALKLDPPAPVVEEPQAPQLALAPEAPAAAPAPAFVPPAPPVVEAAAPPAPQPEPERDRDEDEDKDQRDEPRDDPPTVAPTAEPPPTEPAPVEPTEPAPEPTEEPPVIPANQPPVIVDISCASDLVLELSETPCRVQAVDPDGDELSYEWDVSAESGGMTVLDQPETVYVASRPEGFGKTVKIYVIVRDSYGHELRDWTEVFVDAALIDPRESGPGEPPSDPPPLDPLPEPTPTPAPSQP